jgi:methionyl-tRNA formyltransferase
MDSGEIFEVRRIELAGNETCAALSETSALVGADLALQVLSEIAAGRADPKPQSGKISYCAKISKEDGLIDWSMATLDIDARIRAFNPWPLAYSFLDSQRINILEAVPYDAYTAENTPEALPPLLPGTILAVDRSKGIVVRTGDGYLALARLQFSARKALHHKDFVNGIRNLEGKRFGAEPGRPA